METIQGSESTEPTQDTGSTEVVSAESTPPSLPPEQALEASNGPQVSVEASAQLAYTPNYKITADNKEYEIPERYRPLMTDAQTEKEIRELFEKAYGLDGVKGRFHQTRDEYRQFKEQVNPLLNIARELDYYHKKGDLSSYFKTLGFNDEQILKYALQKAEQLELSPDQKRVYDERDSANRQQYMLEQQYQQTQERLQELMVQQRQVELQTVLSRPEINSFVQSFDRRNGQGAFAQECIQRGRAHYALTGQDLSPDQVAQEIIKKFEIPVTQPMSYQQPPTPKHPAEVPVIPNTGSGSTSPAAKNFKSLDELRKYKAEKFG